VLGPCEQQRVLFYWKREGSRTNTYMKIGERDRKREKEKERERFLWVLPVIPDIWGLRSGGSQFKAGLGK
jgi:hypothetical protein